MIGAKKTSADTEFSLKVSFIDEHAEATIPALGKYVAMVYDWDWYVGCEVSNKSDEEIEVDCMWPKGPARSYH